jgi:hypothetical protein
MASLSDLLDASKGAEKFCFNIFNVQDNPTANQVIEALGGGEGSSITPVWEWGKGTWKKGGKMRYDEDKAGQKLSELGWSGAS